MKGTRLLTAPIEFHSSFLPTMEVNG